MAKALAGKSIRLSVQVYQVVKKRTLTDYHRAMLAKAWHHVKLNFKRFQLWLDKGEALAATG